jgi:hypothetical protein
MPVSVGKYQSGSWTWGTRTQSGGALDRFGAHIGSWIFTSFLQGRSNNYGIFWGYKSTPWRPPSIPKHYKSITLLWLSTTTHSSDLVRSMHRFWAMLVSVWLCAFVIFSLELCCYNLLLCVYSLQSLAPSCNYDLVYGYSNLWRFLANGYMSDKEDCGSQVWSFGHLRGVELQPLSFGTPQHGVGNHFRLVRTTRKINVSCVLICLWFFSIFLSLSNSLVIFLSIYCISWKSNQVKRTCLLILSTGTYFSFSLTLTFIPSLCFSVIFIGSPIQTPLGALTNTMCLALWFDL